MGLEKVDKITLKSAIREILRNDEKINLLF